MNNHEGEQSWAKFWPVNISKPPPPPVGQAYNCPF